MSLAVKALVSTHARSVKPMLLSLQIISVLATMDSSCTPLGDHARHVDRLVRHVMI